MIIIISISDHWHAMSMISDSESHHCQWQAAWRGPRGATGGVPLQGTPAAPGRPVARSPDLRRRRQWRPPLPAAVPACALPLPLRLPVTDSQCQ
jgi:hypothetical protein